MRTCKVYENQFKSILFEEGINEREKADKIKGLLEKENYNKQKQIALFIEEYEEDIRKIEENWSKSIKILTSILSAIFLPIILALINNQSRTVDEMLFISGVFSVVIILALALMMAVKQLVNDRICILKQYQKMLKLIDAKYFK